jgi:hypothetical protein
MDVQEMRWENVDVLTLHQDKEKWRAVVSVLVKRFVPLK